MEQLGVSLPFIGARVVDVLVDSEKTVILFDNGVVLESDSAWTMSLEGPRK